MIERLWFLKQCGLFEQLPEKQLRRIEEVSRAKKFPSKAPIYLPVDRADAVFILATGRAKICHITGDGKQSILALIDPGDMFGELALVEEHSQRDEYAETLEPSMVVMMPGSVVRDIMWEQPEVSLGITKMIGLRRKRIETRLKNVLFLSNRERLAHLLLELAERYGQPDGKSIRIGVGLSHQDLASVIGSTRETVTLVLGELQLEGVVSVGRRRLTLLRPDILDQIARPRSSMPKAIVATESAT